MRAYKRIKMFVHAEGEEDNLKEGDLSCFIRLGTDFTSNFYEYEILLDPTPHYATSPDEIWPLSNEIDIAFEIFQDYENALDQVDVTLSQLEKDGFEGNPFYYLLVAELDNQIIGVCFYFIRYSTWKGKVLFLEDFVVKEEFRRKGIGGMLFEETICFSLDNTIIYY